MHGLRHLHLDIPVLELHNSNASTRPYLAHAYSTACQLTPLAVMAGTAVLHAPH